MPQASVITIGNFDGVHLGHRAILATARELADARNARVVALTFDPHPSATLDPANQPPRLCSPDQKLARLKRAGADEVVVLEPTREVLGQEPRDFVRKLVHEYAPVAFVEGADFRFGKGRAGDIALLKQLGAEHGYEVVIQPSRDVTLSDLSVVTVRSSVIRWLIGHGRPADVQRCLSEPFILTSTIIQGEQRGRTIGIPTANLDLDKLNDHMLPADGVYAGYAIISGDDRRHTAAISVGNKPSFGKVQLTIEAHLLDFAGDLYGQTLTLAFTDWIRDQIKFPTLDALREQLARDIDKVRGLEPLAVSH
ncbi:MAG: riboflavin biosynthesis protein RibF [Phycisphaerales bacterium]